jgi:hypothetical protein
MGVCTPLRRAVFRRPWRFTRGYLTLAMSNAAQSVPHTRLRAL